MICTKCSKETDDSQHYKLENKELCFSCNHYAALVSSKHILLIVNGDIYRDCGNSPGGRWLGFAGRIFRYRRLGEVEFVSTNNMGHCGTVPAVWKDELPDNAEFENVTKHNVGGTICWDVS